MFSFLAALAALVAADGPVKQISQGEALAAAVVKVQPQYPELAKQLKIGGEVDLEVVIGESGSVDAVKPLSGNPVLTRPASDALKKWKFKPFQHDGAPVRAQAVIKISFSK
jgi:protein TonB